VPELNFQISDASVVRHAAVPTLGLQLSISQSEPRVPIESVLLECQVRIEPTRRKYSPAEQSRLSDLFGEPARWGETLRSLLWTHVRAHLPPLVEGTTLELPIPCSFDFNVGATKYFSALESGELPLLILFSGTIFYTADEAVQISRISWEKECRYRLPVSVWREMMDLYYPNQAWLTLRRDIFDRLLDYKQRQSLPTFEQALDKLLAEVQAVETVETPAFSSEGSS